MYKVCVNDPPRNYQPGYFPRRFRLLSDAKQCAQKAIIAGASFARVEFPNGAELDFHPPVNEHVDKAMDDVNDGGDDNPAQFSNDNA